MRRGSGAGGGVRAPRLDGGPRWLDDIDPAGAPPDENEPPPPLDVPTVVGAVDERRPDAAAIESNDAPELDHSSSSTSTLLLGEAELDALFERPVRPRFRMGVGAAVVLALVALAIGLVVAAMQPAPVTTLSGAGATAGAASGLPGTGIGPDASGQPLGTSGSGAGNAGATTLLVHVVGAVASPGVFPLGAGARVIDAVNAAGGFSADADRGAVNLARAVVDGEQLYVPRVGETPPPAPPGPSGPPGGGAGGTGGGGSDVQGGLVNLNTASQAELETLPRIGPTLAQRILDYREQHGGFSSVDELRNVSGIGDATFEALAPLVTV